MEDEDIKMLLDSSERMIRSVSMSHRRYLCAKIDWRDRLICIKGPKGTGKTTLMLQHIRESFGPNGENAVYLAADHIWFASHNIMDAVDYFYSHGFTHLFIDEVHHLPNWAQVIKTITDFYPKLNIAYSGSSILKLNEETADLSRRQAVYDLRGLSFREFLSFESVLNHDAVGLDELLANHRQIARKICDLVKVLPLFERYLVSGYYPLYRDVASQFAERLVDTVNNVLDIDFPAVEDVTHATIRKTKKMLMILAKSCPQEPNMSALYRELETNRNLGIKMFEILERAELISVVGSVDDKLKNMSRPEKVYLGDTNLMHAFSADTEIGTVRETFFLNQVKGSKYAVTYSKVGDFMVNDKFLFEIGGSGKGFDQIKDIPNSYVVNDGVEVGIGNKIPLWLFGFLY